MGDLDGVHSSQKHSGREPKDASPPLVHLPLKKRKKKKGKKSNKIFLSRALVRTLKQESEKVKVYYDQDFFFKKGA